MAITATFGMTKKRLNSTSRVMQATTELPVKLKNPTSIHHPIFTVSGLPDNVRYNYLTYRGGYYYIDDVINVTNDIKDVICRLDPLATFSGSIKDTNAMIIYGDKAHNNSYLDDTRFSPNLQAHDSSSPTGIDSIRFIDIGFNYSGDWSVALTASCATDLAHNGVLTYIMSYSTFINCLNSLHSTFSGDDFRELLAKMIIGGGTTENIRSAVAIPVAYNSIKEYGTATSEIGVGAARLSCNARILDVPVIISHKNSISLPSVSNYAFLKNPRFYSVQVTHPGGTAEINDFCFTTDAITTIGYVSSFCLNTGEYTVKFFDYPDSGTVSVDRKAVNMISGSVGIDLMYLLTNSSTVGGQMIKTEAKIAQAAIGMHCSAIGSPTISESTQTWYDENNAIVGNVLKQTETKPSKNSVYNQYMSGIKGGLPNAGMVPGGGSGAHISGLSAIGTFDTNHAPCYITFEQFVPEIFRNGDAEYEAFCDEYGYPCYKFCRIGDLSGYVQCAGASVNEIPGATEHDKAIINGFLNSGIYIEL